MRRTSLREYQESLAARLRTAESTGTVASQLAMQAGDEFWLLDLADVGEVVPVPELLPVPLTRPWFAGIVNVRGNLYSIVDFPAFLGGAPVALGEQARMLLVGERHRINSGLLFDRVVGLRQAQLFLPAPAPGAGSPPWVAEHRQDPSGRLWKKLDMHALVTHPDFIQIEH